MAELNFVVDQKALDLVKNTPINANFEEVKDALTEMTKPYANMVVTEDQISAAKSDRARIRKVSGSIDNYRKTLKKSYMEQFSVFETKCKELTGICDRASDNLDGQIKEFEESKRQAKLDELEQFYNDFEKSYPDYMDYSRVFNPKWGNATYKIDDAKEEIIAYCNSVDVNVAYVRSLGDEFEAVMLDKLKEGGTIQEAMAISMRLKQQKEHQERMEQERKKAEEERARIEQEAAERAKAEMEEIARVAAEKQAQQYEPIPDTSDDESLLNDLRRTVVAPVAETSNIEAEMHTVNIWVCGTKEQLAALSEVFRQVGVTYGAL